jgi:hypothetical protein
MQGLTSDVYHHHQQQQFGTVNTPTTPKNTWREKFDRLVEYQEAHRHANVPRNHPENPSLAAWVQKQRHNYHTHRLTPERILLLESIGFQWKVDKYNHALWMEMFTQLQQFQQTYGSTKVPIVDSKTRGLSTENDPISRLGRWVKDQRHYYNKIQTKHKANDNNSPMTDQRVELLRSIDFEWSGRRHTDYERWLHQYFQWRHVLQQPSKSRNNWQLSAKDGQYHSLDKWVKRQRKDYHAGKLETKRIQLLQEIGFDFSGGETSSNPSLAESWEEHLMELQLYQERFHSTLVCSHVNPHLGKWTTSVRRAYQLGRLDKSQIDRLRKLNFDFEAFDVSWNAMADRLAAFQKQHGTTMVPAHYGQDRPLAHWVIRQRSQYGKYVLTEQAKDHRHSPGRNDYDSLVMRISQDTGDVSKSQGERSGGHFRKLSPEIIAARICRLIDMGFVWDPLEQQWMEVYKRLVAYQQSSNTTLVPKDYEPDPQLGEWVQKQRKLHNAQKLSQSRIDRLNDIGFVWEPQDVQWQELFGRLKKYGDIHGNTVVPGNYPSDQELANWVATQRKLHKRKALSEERVALLNSIEFLWTLQSSKESQDEEKIA